MEKAIKIAIENGYPAPTGATYYNKDGTLGGWWYKWKSENEYGEEIELENPCCFDHIHYQQSLFLDPLFWQALGKGLGWTWEGEHETGIPAWNRVWHSFIDHLAEGKDINSFFEELTN